MKVTVAVTVTPGVVQPPVENVKLPGGMAQAGRAGHPSGGRQAGVVGDRHFAGRFTRRLGYRDLEIIEM